MNSTTRSKNFVFTLAEGATHVGRSKTVSRFGFTLAEVLITLLIIGVVAAITLSIINNATQDAQYKTAFKKAYSAASQALVNANQQNLMQSVTGGNDPNQVQNFLAFESQFNVITTCFNVAPTNCWATGEKDVNGSPSEVWLNYAFIDSSGMAWTRACGINCGAAVIVDTNGFKQPNRWGKDRFYWFIGTDQDPRGAMGTPVKIFTRDDNNGGICFGTNICNTKRDYYGSSWLYN